MGVTGAAFVSTNFDNLVVLSAFGAKPGYRPLLVKLTFVLVCLTVLFISLALARAADALPADKIRYLGLIPIALGLYQIALLFLGKTTDGSSGPEASTGPTGLSAYIGFALVMLANSSDSIGVLTPLLADLKPAFVLAGFAAALTAAVVMTVLAHILTLHPASKIILEKFAKWVLPFLLVGIGLLIFTDEPTDIFVN